MRAGYAFGITEIDVHSVLSAAGIDKTLEECEQMLDLIDVSEVEAAALHGNDMISRRNMRIRKSFAISRSRA